jgi:hypothetical protein
MDTEKKLLVEKLAEYAERNRFSIEELARLIRLCLQLERDCPGVQFVIPEGNACSVERDLRRQARVSEQPELSQEQISNKHHQVWA